MKNIYLTLPLVVLSLSACGAKPAASPTPVPEQPALAAEEGLTPTSTPTSTKPITNQPMPQAAQRRTTLTPPTMQIDPAKQYTVILHTTAGDITISLNAAATPKTVNNFVYLANQKFYHGTIFHRVITGFMIQGGDPNGNGTGSPGYKFNDEPFTGQYTRGTVAMANSGPNTNGSQFFIMHADYPLPANYVIFGQVTAGMDAVDKIATAPVEPSPSGEPSQPVDPVTVTSVEVYER